MAHPCFKKIAPTPRLFRFEISGGSRQELTYGGMSSCQDPFANAWLATTGLAAYPLSRHLVPSMVSTRYRILTYLFLQHSMGSVARGASRLQREQTHAGQQMDGSAVAPCFEASSQDLL